MTLETFKAFLVGDFILFCSFATILYCMKYRHTKFTLYSRCYVHKKWKDLVNTFRRKFDKSGSAGVPISEKVTQW